MTEQRLIDANPLVKGMKGRLKRYEKEYGYLSDFVSGYEEAIDDVVDTPTIEAKPVVHAHWAKFWNTFYMQNMYCCSKCGNNALTREETMIDQVLTGFCPYCGAQMDEGVKIPVISMEDVPKIMKEMEK